MAVPFQIPNIEQFLPTGANVGAASLPQSPGPVTSAPLSYFDPAQTEEFLKTIELARPPEPQKLKTWQKIVGSLGDAIHAMAAVRAGGQAPPLGPFASTQLQRGQQQREAEMSAEQANRETRNRIRIGRFEEGLRREREKEVAITRQRPIRQQLKTFKTKDAQGRPIDVPFSFDPINSTLSPVEGFEEGFRQYVRPMLAQGVNKETGELEFRLVDPLSGGAPEGVGGQAAGGLSTLEPKPTAGIEESVESASVIGNQLAEFENLSQKYSTGERPLGFVRALGQQVTRETPGGQTLAESLGDPQFEQLAALRDRIGQQLARLVESGRLSDQDREFALRNLPTIPSLKTESGRRTAAGKIQLVRDEINLRLSRKQRLRPGLTKGSGPSIRRSQLRQLSPEDAAATEADANQRGVTIIED